MNRIFYRTKLNGFLMNDSDVKVESAFYPPYVEDGGLDIGNNDPLIKGAIASKDIDGLPTLFIYQGLDVDDNQIWAQVGSDAPSLPDISLWNGDPIGINKYVTHTVSGTEYLFRSLVDNNTTEPSLSSGEMAWTFTGVTGYPDQWSNSATYGIGVYKWVEISSLNFRIYKSLVSGNVGNPPSSSPSQWQEIGAYKTPYSSAETYNETDFVVDDTDLKNYISNINSNTFPFDYVIPGSGTWKLVGVQDTGGVQDLQSVTENGSVTDRALAFTGLIGVDYGIDGLHVQIDPSDETGGLLRTKDGSVINGVFFSPDSTGIIFQEEGGSATELSLNTQTSLVAGLRLVGSRMQLAPAINGNEAVTKDQLDDVTDGLALKADKTTTVNGHPLSANVTVTKGDIGLSNVDNTSDANKPVSSAQQSALNLKADASVLSTYQLKSEKAAANGYASLGADGKVPNSQIPALAISETFVVASQAAMLAISGADQGDVAVRTDISKSFILTATPASSLSNWQELLTPTESVSSVNGQVGNVNLTADDIAETSGRFYVNSTEKNDIGQLNDGSTLTNSVSGNSATVTNGVYTNSSYANPAWILSLAYSKLTGTPDLNVYALSNGSNAGGTWDIDTTGSAAQWNGRIWNGAQTGINSYFMTSNDAGNWFYSTNEQVMAQLGIPSGGETLQSVTDRGNAIAKNGAGLQTSIILKNNSSANSNNGPSIQFSGLFVHGKISSYENPTFTQGGNIQIQTFKNDGTTLNEGIILDRNGNVGIGTVSPTAKLDVNGEIKASAYKSEGSLFGGGAAGSFAINYGTGLSGSLEYYGGSPAIKFSVDNNGNGTFAGKVSSSSAPTTGSDLANKDYVDSKIGTSGTYTPVISGTSNVTSSSNSYGFYTRIGNIVTVTGTVLINQTAANTATIFNFSLPIASNFVTAYNGVGSSVPAGGNDYSTVGTIYSDQTDNVGRVTFRSVVSGSNTITYTFTYSVL